MELTIKGGHSPWAGPVTSRDQHPADHSVRRSWRSQQQPLQPAGSHAASNHAEDKER